MRKIRKSSAFTFIEMMASLGVGVIIGAILFETLWNGSILFAKNSAINVAHQQARTAVMTLENDLHACVSVPQLIDANRNPVSGFGPSAGIAFQSFAGGPYEVAPGDYLTSQNQITVIGNSSAAPAVNQRLNIETHNIEIYISAVSPSGSNFVLTLASNLSNEVNTTLLGQAVNITCFTTEQVCYIVQGTQLLKYPVRVSTSSLVMSNDITSATPFSTPQTAAGAPYNRFVAAINLVCADPTVSNLNFKAANMYLNSMVPYRARLTQTQ